MLGEPTPHEADPTGTQYAFEKSLTKAGGGGGFADVWKRDFFAWEYKGKHKDLKAAYVQLLGYKDDLGNPPLLITIFSPLAEASREDLAKEVATNRALVASRLGERGSRVDLRHPSI